MNASQISAAWLREPRPDGLIPLPASLGLILADALEIADAAARSDIELYADCLGPFWHDVTSKDIDPSARKFVAQAVRYLESRGLLERDSENADMVKLLDSAGA